MTTRDDVVCDECGGTGAVECDCCEQETDCDECGGCGLDRDVLDVEAWLDAVEALRERGPDPKNQEHTWWQGYRDLNGKLIHQQIRGEEPPAWMLEPKRSVSSWTPTKTTQNLPDRTGVTNGVESIYYKDFLRKQP